MTQADIDQMKRNEMLDKMIAAEKGSVEATKKWESENLMAKEETPEPEPVTPEAPVVVEPTAPEVTETPEVKIEPSTPEFSESTTPGASV